MISALLGLAGLLLLALVARRRRGGAAQHHVPARTPGGARPGRPGRTAPGRDRPAGAERISNPPIASRLVIVGSNDPATVIAGSVLARASYGAELVTPPDALPKAVKDGIVRLKPAGVYVVGDESQVSAKVLDQVNAAVGKNVTGLSGPDPASTAVAVAQAMDVRSADDKTAGKAAVTGAVVVNPATPDEAATAVAFAAEARLPILFTGKDAVPDVTTAALRSLNVPSVIVVGGTGSVSDAALNALPTPKRLGGTDAPSTSVAVTGEAVARGMPTNLVYVAPAADPIQVALMGSAVARRAAFSSCATTRPAPTSARPSASSSSSPTRSSWRRTPAGRAHRGQSSW